MGSNDTDPFQYVGSQLHDQWGPRYVVAVCTAMLAVASVVFLCRASGALKFRPDLDAEIGTAFFGLVVLIVSVEIAAAAIVDIFRARGHAEWSMRVQRISDRLEDDTASVEALERAYQRERNVLKRLHDVKVIFLPVDELELKDRNREGYSGWLKVVKGIYEFLLARHAAITRVYVGYVVFIAGILLAVGGVSVFSSVFADNAVDKWFEKLLDWLVTGCVIGGGSARLNAVLSRISVLVNRARQAGIVK